MLFAGNLAYTGITAVTAIFLARLLGPDAYGVYTLAFVIPSLLSLFVGLGVNISVTRYVAYYASSGDVERAKSVTRSATSFLLIFGVLLSIVNYFSASFLVDTLLHRPDLVAYVQLASLFVLGQALAGSASSIFVGWSSMLELSAFTVLQAGLKLVLTIGLILAGFGVLGAVIGHTLSYLAEGVSATIFLYAAHMRPWSRSSNTLIADTKMMLSYGVPPFAGNVVSGLATQYVTIVLAAIAANAVIGYYQAALNVTIAVSVISGTVTNVLYRSFAALHGLEGDTSLAYSYAVRYVSLIITPIVFFLIAGASPLFDLLYGPSYSQGVVLLRLVGVSYLPISVGMTVMAPFLNGVGRSRITMVITVASAIALAAAGYFLAVSFGLGAQGIMLALLVSNAAFTVPGWYLIREYLGIHVLVTPLVGIVAAAVIAALAVALLPLAGLPNVVALAFDCVIFVLIYLTCVPLARGIDGDDIVRLSIAGESLGPARAVLRAVLTYESRILAIIRRPNAAPPERHESPESGLPMT